MKSTFCDTNNAALPPRFYKGTSLEVFADSFVVVDIETTGLRPASDNIIEIAAIKVVNNKIVDRFQSLINPLCSVDYYITAITHITNEMLEDAPTIDAVLPIFKGFIGDSILLGHNVNFDVNFLYENFMNVFYQPLRNDFIDTLKLSRRTMLHLKSHKLEILCREFDLVNDNAHRALSDCEVTLKIYHRLRDICPTDNFSKKPIRTYAKPKTVNAPTHSFKFTGDVSDSPLFEKNCIITGKLEIFNRKDAEDMILDFGGNISNSVTKKTNYLILGNNDFNPNVIGGKSSKHKKADELLSAGCDIQIISEDMFLDILHNYTSKKIV